jgi:hypothetical protein
VSPFAFWGSLGVPLEYEFHCTEYENEYEESPWQKFSATIIPDGQAF